MKTLKKIIFPIDIEKFTKKYFSKSAYHIKGDKKKFKYLLDWQDLNNTLNTSSHIKSHFRMFKDGKPSNFSDSFDMLKNTQDGSTLIIENIDTINIKLGELHDSLENEIGEDTRSNLYLSFPSVKGFDLHYDAHDFLILQLFGKKRWRVYPSTIEQPLFHLKNHGTNKPPSEDSLYLDCVLEQGDVLYVPKGHWHEVIAEGNELSVHLTLAMFIRTGIDFFNWITNELREIPLFRRSFPLTTDDEAKTKNHIKEMNTALSNILNQPDIYNSFMQSRFANFKNRTAFNYPYHIFENSFEQNKDAKLIKSLTPVHISTNNEQIIITAPRTLINFPIELKTVIEYIYNSKTNILNMDYLFSISSNEKLVKEAIEKLISEGLLRKN